jgi:lysophospholipase L1-like esterase
VALLVSSVAFCAALAEIGARAAVDDGYYVWPPGLRRSSRPAPAALAGVDGESSFAINSLGFRGAEPSGDERIRILALGGSTTICVYLDDAETWTYLLQEQLNETLGPGTVWVGNAGRSGHTTSQHRLQAEKLLEVHRDIDLVLLLVGVNDMLIAAGSKIETPRSLQAAAAARPSSRAAGGAPLQRAFSVIPISAESGPWYRRTALARLWQGVRRSAPQGPAQDEAAEFVRHGREMRRQAGRLVDEIPDRPNLVREYTRKLDALVDAVLSAGAQPILLTQPALWSPSLSEEGRARLMFGGPPLDRSRPGALYYSVEALAEGMAAYNAALLRLCERRKLSCIDLAGALPPDLAAFTDDVHYTEEGSRRVAAVIASHLLRSSLRELAGAQEAAVEALVVGAQAAVSFGDSYAVRQAAPIRDRLGIQTVEIAEGGSSTQQWISRYEEWAPRVAALDGPVVVFLSVGSNDERADPPVGAAPQGTATRVRRLIYSFLRLRPDLVVVQTGYNGECAEVEFQDFLPATTDRYVYVETAHLDDELEFVDACHPDRQSLEKRIR